VLPRDLAERMRAELPRAELVEIPGTHHHLVLDAPDAFVRVLEGYLRGLD
jgi:pimeloyl-ACP methyl ester carboxylesterase